MKKNNDQLIDCPRCGNTTHGEIIFETDAQDLAYPTFPNENEHPMEYEIYYYLVRCRTYQGILLYSDCEFDDIPGELNEAVLVYPNKNTFNKDVPEPISKTWNEALKIENVSNVAFAMLIRRALELLCIDKGAKGKNLKLQLEDLCNTQIIPATLLKIGDTLRILGNLSAHPNEFEIGPHEVHEIKDFFLAIIEFVYVAPAKLQRFEDSFKKKKEYLDKLKENKKKK